MVVHAGGWGSQQNKQEPDRHRDLQDRLQLYRLLQPHKCHGGLLQEVHAAWKPKKMMVNTQAVLNHERWRHKCSVARFTTFSNPPTRTTVASAFSGIFSSSFSSCLDLDRCIPEDKDGSFCKRHRRKLGQWGILQYKIEICVPGNFNLYFILLHIDARLCIPRRVDCAHERVGHWWLLLMDVIGTVVVRHQAAQAGRRDVPRKRVAVLLLVTRVTKGGSERQGEVEQEKERERPSMKPTSSRKCVTVKKFNSCLSTRKQTLTIA